MSSATYRLKLHPDVIGSDSLLFDAATNENIKKMCLELLSNHPEQAGEPLRRELASYRKLKIFNDYRIVYRVDRAHKTVFILTVGLRRGERIYSEAAKRARMTGFIPAYRGYLPGEKEQILPED